MTVPLKFTGIFLISVWFNHYLLYAGSDNYPAGARNAAMASVGVMLPDFWSFSHNQAGLGYYDHLTAGIHHENRFLVPEFSMHCIGLTIPVHRAVFGISYSYFGYSLYNESKLGLGIGKAFHERFAAGVQLDYLHVHTPEGSSNSTALVAEAGIMARPLGELYIGFHVFNPAGSRHSGLSGNELIPVIIRFGLGYRFGENLFMGIETEKDLEIRPALYRVGLEYKVAGNLFACTGLQVISDYIQHSFGLGILLGRMRTDVSFTQQQLIGYTPHVSFSYCFR